MAIQSISNATERSYSSGASQSAPQVTQPTQTVQIQSKNQVSSDMLKNQTQSIEYSVQTGNKEDGQQYVEAASEQIKKAVSDLNKRMANATCQLSIHDATNRLMIKIVDNESKEVIREYPAEETLDIIAKAWELAGILVDKKL